METASHQASELQAATKTAITQPVGRVSTGRPAGATATPPQSCYRCGKSGHHPDKCYFMLQKCRSCAKKGHVAKVCVVSNGDIGALHGTSRPNASYNKRFRKTGHNASYVDYDSGDQVDESEDVSALEYNVLDSESLFTISEPDSAILLEPVVNGVALQMELDTGASVSLISEKIWKETFPESELVKSDVLLKTYTGEKLHVLGEMQAQVVYNKQQKCLPLLVVSGSGPSLWGRNWLTEIRLNWRFIKQISKGFEPLVDKYSEIFRNELGTLKSIKVKLVVPENTPAKFFKPQPVLYAIHGAIERDLERLENLGVIEKTNYSDWAAPIVAVPKADGTMRICGDYKVTINPVLQVDQYPVPKAEDLFATLAGGQKFSKLDLSQAYQQVLLEDDSRKFITINTHKGLYQFNRLPFGVVSAPAIFQQTMEKILQGLSGVTVNIDDILVMGRNDEEHLDALKKVLHRLSEYGLRLNREKCSFMQPSVEYLGYIVDKDGLHATPAKIEAIVNAPTPR